jgi:hypothetical protein
MQPPERPKKEWTLKSAVEQLESCDYHAIAGSLIWNDAFIWIKYEASLDVVCPFCGEGEFDKIGLKLHLERGHCDEYREVDVPCRHT